MKKRFYSFLAVILVLTTIGQSFVSASDISLYNNNTMTTTTDFSITETGEAIVYVDFTGYSGVTTGATINITIEKRSFLFFWNDVVTETITVYTYRYDNEFYYQLEDKGTYRCTVEYIVSGSGGADDVLTFEDTATY